MSALFASALSPAPRGRLCAQARTLALTGLALLAFLGLSGCAARNNVAAPQPEAVDWRLTPGASRNYYYLLLQQAQATRDTALAEKAVQGLIPLDPSPEVFNEAANFFWRQGETVLARDVLKKGLEVYPDHFGMVNMLVQTYTAENRPDAAALTLESYLERRPDYLPARLRLGAAYIQVGDLARALDTLKVIEEEDRSPQVLYYMAKAHQGLGLHKQAARDLKKAIEIDAGFEEAWAELAYVYETQKDYVAAEETYNQLLSMRGQDAGEETTLRILLRLIDLNLTLNNPDKALALAQRPVLDPVMDTDFRLQAGGAFLDQGFFDQAEVILEPLKDLDTPPSDLFFYLAMLAYDGRGDAAKAAELLSNIPEGNPNYERSLVFRCHLLIETGKPAEALDLIHEGMRRFPDQPEFATLEAQMAQNRGNLEQALGLMETAAAKWPEDTDVLYYAGVLMEEAGRTGDSLKLMEKIVSLDPDHADALNFLGYTLAEQGRDLERALVLIRKALEHKPDSGYILDSLAWVLFRTGQMEEARDTIVRATAVLDRSAVVWEHYGDIHNALGLKDEALKGYDRCLELGPDDPSNIRRKRDSL